MKIEHDGKTAEVDHRVIAAIGAFYAMAQFRKHLKNGGTDPFEAKVPGLGRRKLTEGEKWLNKYAKLSPEVQAEVKAALPS